MYSVGCLITLRRAKVLYDCKILSGTGIGNLLLGFLARAFKKALDVCSVKENINRADLIEEAWTLLTVPKSVKDEKEDDQDFFITEFVDPLYEFCERGIEGELLVNRLYNWRAWRSPWFIEFEAILDKEFNSLKMKDIALTDEGFNIKHQPLFLFNGQQLTTNGALISTTNAFKYYQRSHHGSPFAEFMDTTDINIPLSTLITACGLPLAHGAYKKIKDFTVMSSVEIDPFGWGALGMLCIKLKIDADNMILIDGLSHSKTYNAFGVVSKQQINYQLNRLMGPSTRDWITNRSMWNLAFNSNMPNDYIEKSISSSKHQQDHKHKDSDDDDDDESDERIPSINKEELKLFRKQPLQMLDPVYRVSNFNDNDCVELLGAIEQFSNSSLKGMNRRLLIHTVNFGACVAAKYLGITPKSKQDVFINLNVGDDYNIFYSVFPSCPEYVPSVQHHQNQNQTRKIIIIKDQKQEDDSEL